MLNLAAWLPRLRANRKIHHSTLFTRKQLLWLQLRWDVCLETHLYALCSKLIYSLCDRSMLLLRNGALEFGSAVISMASYMAICIKPCLSVCISSSAPNRKDCQPCRRELQKKACMWYFFFNALCSSANQNFLVRRWILMQRSLMTWSSFNLQLAVSFHYFVAC